VCLFSTFSVYTLATPVRVPLFNLFCLYSSNSCSCASFQLFPHVLLATSSSSNLFIPLCPDDSPSLVHFFPYGQATHLLPPVFHFFIFPFHLASPLTAPLSFIHFSTFALLHSFFFIYSHIPLGTTHSSNLTGSFTFTGNQSPHMPSLV
jgi:hypothetical protein